MPDYPIVDIHTHLFRTPEVGKRAFWRNPHTAIIPYTGLPEDYLAGHKDAGVAYSAAMIVTPTREMRQRDLRERGEYGTSVWENNSGIKLDQKLLTRMDHNNAWGCWNTEMVRRCWSAIGRGRRWSQWRQSMRGCNWNTTICGCKWCRRCRVMRRWSCWSPRSP